MSDNTHGGSSAPSAPTRAPGTTPTSSRAPSFIRLSRLPSHYRQDGSTAGLLSSYGFQASPYASSSNSGESTPLLRTGSLENLQAANTSSIDAILKKANASKAGRLLDMFAVESEPGLTHVQLMLANRDLKPVEQERREWRSMYCTGATVTFMR